MSSERLPELGRGRRREETKKQVLPLLAFVTPTHDKRSRPRGDHGAQLGDVDLGPHPKHAKHNSSFLKSDQESTREFGRLQGGHFYAHSERPTVGRPRGDPRCGSTQGRLPAVDLSRALPNLR